MTHATFVCHQEREIWEDNELAEDDRCQLLDMQQFWGQFYFPELKGRPVLDLDLDYYFLTVGNEDLLAFSDQFIKRGIEWLASNLPPETVITVALSPDCCGPVSECIRVCAMVCKALGVTPPDLSRFWPDKLEGSTSSTERSLS